MPRVLPEKEIWIWKSQQSHDPSFRLRKNKGAVPHDLGVPTEDPFFMVNQFNWQDTNVWKDLNSKFVLMVYRDVVLTGRGDKDFLHSEWPAVKEAIACLRQFDHGSGTPEGGGYPDQTYDEWVVRGVSAYSGGLWLGALRAAEEMAQTVSESDTASRYHEMFLKAQNSYVTKLWNGEYFRYDTESEYRDNIQADQLAGQWYADLTGLGDLVPRRDATEGSSGNLCEQRHEVCQRRNGRRERHCYKWLHLSEQPADPRGLDRNVSRVSRADAERGIEGSSLSHGLGCVSRDLRNEGVLVPYS
jgi:non-lysosomal glucosylceramidase